MRKRLEQASTIAELEELRALIVRLRKQLTGRTVRRMMKDDIEYIKIKIKEMR